MSANNSQHANAVRVFNEAEQRLGHGIADNTANAGLRFSPHAGTWRMDYAIYFLAGAFVWYVARVMYAKRAWDEEMRRRKASCDVRKAIMEGREQ